MLQQTLTFDIFYVNQFLQIRIRILNNITQYYITCIPGEEVPADARHEEGSREVLAT